MALAARLVSRSRQLYSVQAALANGGVTQVRSFAKEAAPVSGDDLLKGIFFEVKKKFETALGVLKKERSRSTQMTQQQLLTMPKADLLSDSQRIKYTIETFTKGIPDARTYLDTLQQLRKKLGFRKEDLPKIEEELEMQIAKAELTELKKEVVVEAMEGQLKREEFKDEEMPDVRKWTLETSSSFDLIDM
ncbi:mitochondrial ATP synthase precursor [Hordeum vulgare]|nr:mitochondrial ATP synthase precursor [Hordeum vulgare]